MKTVVPALVLSLLGATAHAASIDFDSMATGGLITTVGEVTFTSDTGLPLVVSSIFDTSSGFNYLGVADTPLEVFMPGDTVTLAFSLPVTYLAVKFVSSPATPGGLFSIITDSGTVLSGASPTLTLPDGGEVFALEFFASTPFSAADLSSAGTGLYSYNLDDIVYTPVPVPAALPMLGFSVLGGLLISNRRKARRTR